MQVTKISYGLTVQTENGTYVKEYVEADIFPGDDIQECQNNLMQFVLNSVKFPPIMAPTLPDRLEVKEEEEVKEDNQPRRAVKRSPAPAKKGEPKTPDKPKPVEDPKVTEGEPETTAEEDKPEKPEGKSTRSSKSKTIPYDREKEEHKTLLSKLLIEVCPNWKKSPETKLRARNTSETMVGIPFIDSDGNILDSFKTLVSEKMNLDDENL